MAEMRIDTKLEDDAEDEEDHVFKTPIRHEASSSVRRKELLRSGSLSVGVDSPDLSSVPLQSPVARFLAGAARSGDSPASPIRATPTPKKVIRQASTMSSMFGQMAVDPTWGDRLRPTLIVANMIFEGGSINVDKVRAMIKERLLIFPRFRSQVAFDSSKTFLSAISFQELPLDSIDLDYHVQTVGAGEKWAAPELNAFISQLYAQNMQLDKPLWKFYLITKMADGNDLLMAVIDHSIADGATLVQVLFSIMDDDLEEKTSGKESSGMKVSKRASPLAGIPLIHRAFWFAEGVIKGILGPAADAPDKANALKIKDHRNPGMEKALHMSDKISLADVKVIKNKIDGVSINDVFAALLTMTLRRYYEEIGDPVATQSVRASFPVNLRTSSDTVDNSFGNRIVVSKFRCDFNYRDALDAIYKTKYQSDQIKSSVFGDVVAQKMMTILLPLLPKEALLDVLFDAFAATTAMLSNVPGPQQQVKLMGNTIKDLNFFALPPIGIYLGILSYNGGVSLGVVTDSKTCDDPVRLTKHWALAWQDMQKCVSQAELEGTLLSRRPSRPLPLASGAWILLSSLLCGCGAWLTATFLRRVGSLVGVF